MKINDFFQESYCINLDRRKDRWESCSAQFAKNNIEVKRISAIDGREFFKSPSSGTRRNASAHANAALNLNHTMLIQECKAKKIKSILIFEDDVLFVDNFERQFFELSKKVPEDWDILYLGGYHEGGLDKICDRVYKCKWTLCMHAIGIHSRMFDEIIKKYQSFMETKPADHIIADMHSKCNAYTFYPFLATQASGYSDINFKKVDNSKLIK